MNAHLFIRIWTLICALLKNNKGDFIMKIEYKVISNVKLIKTSNAADIETELNKHGIDGWELVAIHGEHFIFKKID